MNKNNKFITLKNAETKNNIAYTALSTKTVIQTDINNKLANKLKNISNILFSE